MYWGLLVIKLGNANTISIYANMAKLEYASGLSPDGGNTVWVRLPLLAPFVPPPDTINREIIVENRSKSGNSRERLPSVKVELDNENFINCLTQ